jgi:capsular polysaccharide transport system permease protein
MSSANDGPADTAGGRDLVLQRGNATSALLRRAARIAQEDALPVSSLPSILRPKGSIEDGEGGWFAVFIRVTFILLFVIPATLIVGYYTFVASGQYSSEFRFALKTGEISPLEQASGLGMLTSGGAVSLAQDTVVITSYVTSRPLVEQLQAEIDLRAIFSRDDIDPLSAFDPEGSIEDLVHYWGQQVHVGIDGVSGLVTISVRAFTPEDALRIAQAMMRHSEQLVNSLSDRTIGDLIEDTEQELGRAETRLKETRGRLQALRNTEGTLDPDESAKGLAGLIDQLRLEKAQAETEFAVMSGRLSPSAPQLRPVRERIAAIEYQIQQLEADLTGGDHEDSSSLASKTTRFDELELDNMVAERRYAAAVSALEAARLTAERQRRYLAPFVEPQLAEDPTAPSRMLNSVAGFVGPFMLWAALVGLIAFVRRKIL